MLNLGWGGTQNYLTKVILEKFEKSQDMIFTLAIVYFDIYNKIIINYDNNTRCETSVYVL